VRKRIASQHQHLVTSSGLIQFLPELLTHLDKAAGQVLLFGRFPILFLPFFSGPFAGALDPRNFLEANRQRARADWSVAVQRHQQRGLQEAQTQHQIEVKRR
jgi:hypothetical protein